MSPLLKPSVRDTQHDAIDGHDTIGDHAKQSKDDRTRKENIYRLKKMLVLAKEEKRALEHSLEEAKITIELLQVAKGKQDESKKIRKSLKKERLGAEWAELDLKTQKLNEDRNLFLKEKKAFEGKKRIISGRDGEPSIYLHIGDNATG